MAIYVYQTFEIKQDKFEDAISNLKEIQKYRNQQHNQKVEILTPVSGHDHTYSLLITYEGLAEMELSNKKLFDDDEYVKLIQPFFLENIVQGSMHTQIFRSMWVEE
ncbi:hypothetical protein SM124_07315 [Bacillus sp. 31A1R]|uniref:Uncharacterized protein n=1 Tax=Robertmurraya mangrovi TaxID=3098077 RepID=A0ABU5IWN0_9BACI|nr:hypothetical protein [Bacillus sp. 31A1R]MDZ5471554.1 hypothetical protein [Bacillus sp. 31A1R]